LISCVRVFVADPRHGDADGSPKTISALPAAIAMYWCPPAW